MHRARNSFTLGLFALESVNKERIGNMGSRYLYLGCPVIVDPCLLRSHVVGWGVPKPFIAW